tara:strand:+ start:527 stop:694 length:168 start_codon:yes stop_codon:yes gene_type:complete
LVVEEVEVLMLQVVVAQEASYIIQILLLQIQPLIQLLLEQVVVVDIEAIQMMVQL